MKNLVNYITALLFISTITYGQDQQLVEVETNQIIEMNAANAWSLVDDWKNLPSLVPAVVESTTVRGEGLNSTWTINLVNGNSIIEKMVYYDLSERTMSYIMTETPMPIEDYLAIIKVEQYGISKSLISFYTRCHTATESYDKIKSTFKEFQETYLSNIRKLRQ